MTIEKSADRAMANMFQAECKECVDANPGLKRPEGLYPRTAVDIGGCCINGSGYDVDLLRRMYSVLHIPYEALYSDINTPRAWCCTLAHACGAKWPEYDEDRPFILDPYYECLRNDGKAFPQGLVDGADDPLSEALPPRKRLQGLVGALMRAAGERVVVDMAYRFGINGQVDEQRLSEALSDALWDVIANPPETGTPSWVAPDDWGLVAVKYANRASRDESFEEQGPRCK